jgi:hypothetical protein
MAPCGRGSVVSLADTATDDTPSAGCIARPHARVAERSGLVRPPTSTLSRERKEAMATSPVTLRMRSSSGSWDRKHTPARRVRGMQLLKVHWVTPSTRDAFDSRMPSVRLA